ncbi:MAG TPA: 2-phospho-L-lactate transferase [Acidimicrobiaceae bacterium]|nr:2-phospho-L-lactate transferase [Acidimicrobiaceae bacterium]HCB37518.1 2-phospho-L-lactate transferase [Acidimicrobiaceae bacterium]
MRVTVLAGGVGAARFLRGLVQVVGPAEVTAVVNVGDDFTLHGLAISPDIDTVCYTLAGEINPETGWGRATESWRVLEELRRLGGRTWFRLGDLDLALHLYRTQRLAEGATLSEVTAEVAAAKGVGVRLLPVSDDPIRTRLVPAAGELAAADADAGAADDIAFQDYFVVRRHDIAVSAVRFAGVESARPAPGVAAALADADVVVIAPSNPFVSIGPVLAVPGVTEQLERRRDSVVAVSPIVGGSAVKGPAGRMMTELGHECSAVGVAALYCGVAATLVIDDVDAGLAPAVEATGMTAAVADTIMDGDARAAAVAAATLAAVP